MKTAPASFAIPGDIDTVSGGYIYERRLLHELRAAGRDVDHLRLGASFPDPTPTDMADAITQLAALDPARPLILDGFLSGAMDPAGIAQIRAPMVAMVHHPLALETGLTEDRKAHLFATERDNLAQMRHVLVPSPHTKAILVADYGVPEDRITVARPGIDQPGTLPDPATPPMILSVGLQHPRKGHDVLIDALARIADLDWQAVIIGGPHDPVFAAGLAARVIANGLDHRVTLAGQVTGDDLARHYAKAAIFALATRYEGYGIVFDEALCHGLPIVSCRTGAVPDTVPQDAGILVPVDDAGAFADALAGLLQDDPARGAMAAAAGKAGRALPGWSDTARIAGEVLDRLAQG